MKTARTIGKIISIAVVLTSTWLSPAIAQRAPVVQAFDLRVPWQPAPIKVNGQWDLLYELHLDNYSAEPLQPEQLRVIDADNGHILRDYDAAAVRAMLGGPGLSGKKGDTAIAPGAHAVIYLNLGFDAAPTDLHLTHELSAERPDGGAPVQAQGGTLMLHGWPAPVVFSPPLRGGYWVAVYDGSWARGHRRSLYAVNGAVHVPGRFAIDWIKVDGTFEYKAPARQEATAPAEQAPTSDSSPPSADAEAEESENPTEAQVELESPPTPRTARRDATRTVQSA